MYHRQGRRERRVQVHQRIRRKVAGTAQRPRLAVFRSLSHIYTQVIDDAAGRTLVAASTVGKKAPAKGGNIAAAKAIGKQLAERALEAGIKEVVFDRGGHKYHGRVKALAEAARETGLKL